jgi:hypothetical protein
VLQLHHHQHWSKDMKKFILASIAALSLNAHATYFIDGNKLLNEMDNNSGRMYSLGYVVGVVDSLNQVVFCLPPTVTAGQIKDMIHNYLRNTPAERHLPASVIIANAFIGGFPCSKGANL